MLSTASHLNPVVNRILQEFGGTQPDLALTLLERTQGEPFASAMNRLLKADPALRSLNDDQKRKLFALWTERGAAEQLAAFVEQHPEALALAWRGVAKHRAARRDFAGAVEVARQFSARPTLPQATSGSSIDELQRNLFADPANYGTAFALYHQQMQAGRTDDALMTVRRMTEQPGSPAYFHYLEAEAWGAKGDAERAWNAWQAYERAVSK
jgi:thioredoxin-like negative regulator of GroEL